MKTIVYNGSSKIIKRIVHLLNRKAPIPLDGDGDAVWGTNGQVLTTDGNGNTSWTTPQGGGGDVTDVEVNGTSVVNAQGVAEVSVPTATSDLNNDSGFITNLVNDLANYYTKSQTYTQAEVNALISGIVTLNILVVQALPTQDISTTTIYLVPKQDAGTDDIYDEYLYINNAWELIGTTQIDLSNYVTTTDLSTALADYVTSVGLATILADYVQSSDLAAVATSGSYNDLSNKPKSIPVESYSSDTCDDMYADYDNFTFGAGTVNGGAGKDTPTTSTAWRILQTRLDAYAGIQFAYHTDTDDVYMRRKENNTWSSWVRLALASEVPDMTNVAYKNINNNFTENQTIDKKNGTTSAVANSMFSIGNNIPEGTDKNSRGILGIYSNTAKIALLWAASNLSNDINIYLPKKGGDLALTSDITDVSTGTVTSSHTIGTGTSVKKNGKVVTLSIQITLTSNVAQYANFASVPVGYRNSAYSYAVAVGGYGIVVSGGSVNTLTPIPTGTVVSCSFTYITND